MLVIAVLSAGSAAGYFFDGNSTVIGAIRSYTIANENESLIELARKFDLGYNGIIDANPGIDPYVPGADKAVILPLSWILPDVKVHKGIIINLAELRLYYFFAREGKTQVRTFPIGIGDEGSDTPLGAFSVIEKITNPAWHVPASIRKEKPDLPQTVRPGPHNPLGSHAMRLSLPTIMIHGTNKPWGVGRRVSHGCIRLYPEDIPKLFSIVPIGTSVTIVNQPVKIGVKEERVYIEVHKGYEKDSDAGFKAAIALLVKKHLLVQVSTVKLLHALSEMRGFPVDISNDEKLGDSRIDLPCGKTAGNLM